ncbi:MAG: dihydropteroate synthase [Agathobacter sp.]|nr:dihydropteroate synthase [Agathobacter sp.]
MKIGHKEFDLNNHCYIMGILNVTPDSFSDGGKYNNLDRALKHTEEMIADGADIIDVGGESTRPGHEVITDEEEIARVAPVIEAIRKNFDIPISIDTYKGAVTEAALQAGADLVNDIWGFKHDEQVAKLTAKYNVACCLMHNRDNTSYNNFQKDFLSDMRECIELAKKAGVSDDKIILDPGVGFGKTYEHNLEIINHVDIMHELGYPILLGTSRKSVIGLTLDLPATERVEGTLATTVIGIMKGCSFVRVHDIKENYRIIKMTEAILSK